MTHTHTHTHTHIIPTYKDIGITVASLIITTDMKQGLLERIGAGEMDQWLRAHALPEVGSSIPSNYMVAHNHL
jgi:diadenosine tetraphosphate (Ap4A) HIT family hydrolase